MKSTGYKVLKKGYDYCFLKWGQYMKRAQIAEMKVEKLKGLLLLTDPAVSNVEVNDVALRQWQEYLKAFPEEA